jgi:hypothetical protein
VLAVVGAAALLLVLVTWAASIGPDQVVSGGHISPARAESPTPTATEQPLSGGAQLRFPPQDGPPTWQKVLALALELLTLGVALFLLVRLLRTARRAWKERRRRRRRSGPGQEDVAFEVVGSASQVSEAIAEDAEEQRTLLAVTGQPRDAIVECWHRFEVQAGRAGAQRRVWQTTSEFVLGVLDLVGADRGAVAELAELYREARFSDHPMTDAHRSRALAALDTIHRSLRTRVAR